MTAFTADNWAGADVEIAVMNAAFELAWKCLDADGAFTEIDDLTQVRHSLCDALNNEFVDGISARELAQNALRRIDRSAAGRL